MYGFGKLAIIGLAHVGLGVLLYSGRIHRWSPILQSDLLVLYLPGLLALCASFFVAYGDFFVTFNFVARLALASTIALLAVAASSICFATVAFNKYGT